MSCKKQPRQWVLQVDGGCAKKDYAWNYNEVNRMDKLTQGYLHKLELGDLDYKERAKNCHTAYSV